MNRSSLPVIIIVAIVSGAIGWFAHTPPAPSEKTADASPAEAPKVAAPSAPASGKVATPTVAPAPVAAPAVAPAPVAAASAPAAAAPAPAQAATPATPGATPPELANVIMELTNLVQAGDLVSVYENYMPPQKMAAMTAEQKAYIENAIRQQMQGPNGPRVIQGQMAIIQALSTVTPTLNAAGDHATFQVPTPAEMAPAGANLPPTLPINFVKVDGKWYLDQ